MAVKKKLNVVMIGVSCRGLMLLRELVDVEGVKVIGVCDLYEDRVKDAIKKVKELKGYSPKGTTNYHDFLKMKEVDAVVVPTSWESHVKIAIDCMKAGKPVGIEVGGAYSIQQCWDLVRTYQETGVRCMMLENCCYGKTEMTVLNMVKKGLFGELVHAEGGYRHDLRDEVCQGHQNRHYRQDNLMHRNAELYPTHELGPIAKWLGINRGNRMISLYAMASKSAGLQAWAKKNSKKCDKGLGDYKFSQGDIVTTLIKCANGETITLVHDISLPRPYSRGNVLQGTRGIWSEDCNGFYIEGITAAKSDDPAIWSHPWTGFDKVNAKYEHPLWKAYRKEGIREGHDGMDWLVLNAFCDAVKRDVDFPIDVYDAAAWMAVTILSEDSLAAGVPVAFPDFTEGAWLNREPAPEGKYSL